MRLYDVFISHASEDKETFVRPLAELLRNEHIEVWYDEFSLKLGDSLRQTVDLGLSRSRYGVVVLSPVYPVAIVACRPPGRLFRSTRF